MKPEDLQNIHPLNRLFVDYWESLPKSGLVPSRSAFDPTVVPELLPRFLMYEFVTETDLRIRLCGTLLVRRYGMDITGRNYLDFVAKRRRRTALRAMRVGVDWPVGMLNRIIVRTMNGQFLQTESLGFPLSLETENGLRQLYLFHSLEDNAFPFDIRGEDELLHFGLRERTFIDIGNGVPTPFKDEIYSTP